MHDFYALLSITHCRSLLTSGKVNHVLDFNQLRAWILDSERRLYIKCQYQSFQYRCSYFSDIVLIHIHFIYKTLQNVHNRTKRRHFANDEMLVFFKLAMGCKKTKDCSFI